jgi:hypothetical protein
MMIFVASTVVLCSLVPSTFAFVPLMLLIVGPDIILGGLRLLFTLINFVVVMFIIFELCHSEKIKKKVEGEMRFSNRRLFFILYLAVGISLIVAAFDTFSFEYLNLIYWGIILLFALAGWVYPRTNRYSTLIGITYWAGILVSDAFVFRQASADLGSIAAAANLSGIYFALLRLSPMRVRLSQS